MNRHRAHSTPIAAILLLTLALTACSETPPASPHKGDEAWTAQSGKVKKDPWISLHRLPVTLPPDSNAAVDLTRNIYIIFDGSGSMSERVDSRCGANERFDRKIDGARWALTEFVASAPDNINLGLYVFDRRGSREVMPLARLDRETFKRHIQDISAGGSTPLASSIRYASDRLGEQYIRQLGYGEFRLVIITDGLAEAIPKAAFYAAERGIPIYTIGLCVEDNHPLLRYSVSYQAVDNFIDLQKSLSATLAELPDFDTAQFPTEERP
jgi:hypothetical protein